MRRRTVALLLALDLVLVALSTWADKSKEPADNYPSNVASVWFDSVG